MISITTNRSLCCIIIHLLFQYFSYVTGSAYVSAFLKFQFITICIYISSPCNIFTPQIKEATWATCMQNVAWLHLGSNYIDIDVKANCGDWSIYSCDLCVLLGFGHKNQSDETCFVVLTIVQVEKHWTKVIISAIAYSLSGSQYMTTLFLLKTRNYEVTIL